MGLALVSSTIRVCKQHLASAGSRLAVVGDNALSKRMMLIHSSFQQELLLMILMS